MDWRYDLRLAHAFEYNIECIHSRKPTYIDGFKTHEFKQNTFFILRGYSFYRFHITNIITMYFIFKNSIERIFWYEINFYKLSKPLLQQLAAVNNTASLHNTRQLQISILSYKQ